jgi:hypothetical protein
MMNLYWKTNEKTRNLIPTPFKSETEFEAYIFQNQELLGDVYIIHRQIRTGTKQGIPDMIGVNQEGSICIIEMKNNEVGEDILPQVLSYAIWAETNPDSIKAIWLESPHKPEDIELDWDNLEIRAIVVAPGYRSTVLRMASKIGYPIDLVQIQRFSFENEEFLLVDVLEEQIGPKIGTTKVLVEWEWDHYEKEHGKTATAQFKKAVEEIDRFVTKKGWELPYNLNKYHTGFKLGNRVVFSVYWGGTHAWHIRFKLPEGFADGFEDEHWEFQRYDRDFKEALIRPKERGNAPVANLEHFLVSAYKHVSGMK